MECNEFVQSPFSGGFDKVNSGCVMDDPLDCSSHSRYWFLTICPIAHYKLDNWANKEPVLWANLFCPRNFIGKVNLH